MKIRPLAFAGLFALSVTTTLAAVITENFAADPLQDGWKTFGNSSLFHWNAANQNLEVTWDCTNQNSYFYRPLGTILTTNDAFSLSFDLRLDDAAGSYEIAVGFLRFADATNAAFCRGTGTNSPNLAEFNYFPDYWSIDATTSDTNSHEGFTYDYTLPLETGTTYHIELAHALGDTLLTASIYTNGVLYTALPVTYANPAFTDFRLDTLAISCYSTNGDPYGDTLLAHGVVDNFNATLPPPPVQNLAGRFDKSGIWECTFLSQTNWTYTLERSTNLVNWAEVGNGTGVDGVSVLSDQNFPPDNSFYRVRAERP